MGSSTDDSVVVLKGGTVMHALSTMIIDASQSPIVLFTADCYIIALAILYVLTCVLKVGEV